MFKYKYCYLKSPSTTSSIGYYRSRDGIMCIAARISIGKHRAAEAWRGGTLHADMDGSDRIIIFNTTALCGGAEWICKLTETNVPWYTLDEW
jgi:hypothetical protein